MTGSAMHDSPSRQAQKSPDVEDGFAAAAGQPSHAQSTVLSQITAAAVSTSHWILKCQVCLDMTYSCHGCHVTAPPMQASDGHQKSRVQRPLLWQLLQRLGVHGVMLRAIQSLYKDSGLTIHINGRRGQTFQSVTGVKQGCPMSPTLFGLYMDGLHRYLMSIDILDVPMLSSGIVLPNLDYADDTALMASSAHGLQHLINDVSAFCNLMGMIISVAKTKIMVFNARYPGPYQWLCNGEQLEVVSTFKYLGLTFHAEHGLQPTFMALKQKMFASWALLKRQYGRLRCLSSVGLMFRLCTTVVQSTACYGCEVWGAATFAAKEREDLMKGYLQILREITGVRTSTPTAILLAELGLQALSDEWLLRAAKFWNNLAALPPDNIHRCMALDSCKSAIGPRNRRKNWAGSMYRAIIDTGYQLAIRLDDMDAIDITALRHFITQRRDAVWEGLDVCPRTCPSVGARLCTYAAWFARPPHKHARSLLDLPLSSRCMQTLFRFRMGVHRLPKDEGSWSRVPRHERLCLLCNLGSLCDEKHVVFECSALQGLRDEYASLFSDVCTMKQFLWQDDLVSVAKFIHACLDKMFSCETGLSNDSQASDQPDVAGRDVT